MANNTIRLTCLIWISGFTLAGCMSFTSPYTKKNNPTMDELYYQHHYEQSEDSIATARQSVDKTHLLVDSIDSSSTRLQAENQHPFKKLPNPSIPLYIYPHFAGQEQYPVPGYTTEFALYERGHYALPHEIFY